MYIAPGGIVNPITSGSITSGSIASGAVVSGTVASGAIMGSLGGGPFNIASGTIGTNDIAAGTIITVNIASGAAASGEIASGAVPGYFGPTRVIQSGTIGVYDLGSGALQSGQFASGILSDSARWLQDDYYTAAEMISGVRCVGFNQSGMIQIAMASVSGRMPAIGVAISNIASGTLGLVNTYGRVHTATFSSSGFFFSGFINNPGYVDVSGCITSLSGVSGINLPLSGYTQQIIGRITSASGLFITPH